MKYHATLHSYLLLYMIGNKKMKDDTAILNLHLQRNAKADVPIVHYERERSTPAEQPSCNEKICHNFSTLIAS